MMIKLQVQLGQSVDITVYCRHCPSFVSSVLLMRVLITSHLSRIGSSRAHLMSMLLTDYRQWECPGKSNRPGDACNVSIEHERLCRENAEKVNGREHSQCKHTVVHVRKKLSKQKKT